MTRIRWKKASFSGEQTDCVELATDGQTWVAVRDSKQPGDDALILNAASFRTFVGTMKTGQVDA